MVCLKLPENYQACPGYKAAELGGCVLDLGERALGSSRWWPPPLPNSSFRALTASAEQLPIPDSLFFPMSVHGAVSLAHHGYSGQHLSTRQSGSQGIGGAVQSWYRRGAERHRDRQTETESTQQGRPGQARPGSIVGPVTLGWWARVIWESGPGLVVPRQLGRSLVQSD